MQAAQKSPLFLYTIDTVKTFFNLSAMPPSNTYPAFSLPARFSPILCLGLVLAAPALLAESFPFEIPKQKPDRAMSAAMNRLYDQYMALMPEESELYSNFRYTPLKGLDYHNGDGTISRRDPSKVIKFEGKYYVWYTRRDTAVPPLGLHRAAEATDTIASSDWDLAEIWYATSKDGITWTEQGVAVKRPPAPAPGWRSVTTTDILIWRGKYYLYFQAFMDVSGRRGDDCPVSVAYADSPNGPWTHSGKIVIPNGAPGEWDQYSIHDPYVLVYHGRIYLYYKSDWNRPPGPVLRAHGLAIADDPLGPFTKHPLNPIMNSGHETTLFPFKQGIAAIAQHNGLEHNTIQFAPDGVNFHVESTTTFPPIAAGPYVPDAFSDTKDGRGITWGISHFTTPGTSGRQYSILARFDCDLSQDLDDPDMKRTDLGLRPEIYFTQSPSAAQQKRIAKELKAELEKP